MYLYCMHRTQIQLEDWQYETLKERSRKEYKSLSQLIRYAVDLLIGHKAKSQQRRQLSDICGIATDNKGRTARDHDKYLYHSSK